MRHQRHNWIGFACVLLAFCFFSARTHAQRHSYGSAPPTAPPHAPAAPVAVSSGMGAIQFDVVNYGVPPPQALTRQLRAEDDRTRAAALSAIGAPLQYMQRGHIVTPHSIQLEFVPLGNNDDEVQALLTAELDQHIVTAILVEDDGTWRRIATLLYATSFEDIHSTPSTFVHTARSLMQHDRYQAVFRAATNGPNGSFVENEADLRIINGKPVITMNFADAERDCGEPTPAPRHPRVSGCTVTARWFQADPIDPYRIFLLVSATGHVTNSEAAGAFAYSRDFLYAHTHSITCQRFAYSDTSLHFEPTGPPGPCPNQ